MKSIWERSKIAWCWHLANIRTVSNTLLFYKVTLADLVCCKCKYWLTMQSNLTRVPVPFQTWRILNVNFLEFGLGIDCLAGCWPSTTVPFDFLANLTALHFTRYFCYVCWVLQKNIIKICYWHEMSFYLFLKQELQHILDWSNPVWQFVTSSGKTSSHASWRICICVSDFHIWLSFVVLVSGFAYKI